MVVKKKKPEVGSLLLNHPFNPPYLPERLRWSVSSLKLFRKCKRKWFWRYIMRIKPKWSDSNLLIGSKLHETLAMWYADPQMSRKKLLNKISKQSKKLLEEIQVSADYYDQDELDKSETLTRTFHGMMAGYTDVYRRDVNDWLIDDDDIEAEFTVELPEYDFFGYIDLLPTDRKSKRKLIVEHKSVSRIGDSYVDRLPLDTQVRGYIYGAIEGLGIEPTEVIYDVVRKCTLKKKSGESQEEFNQRIALDYTSRPNFYFFRESLKFSKGSIKAFKRDMDMTHEEFCRLADDKRGLTPERWTCSDHVCNEFFKTCPYLPICLGGLDRGSANLYVQSKHVDEEEKVDE